MSAASPALVKIGDLNPPTLIAYQLWRPYLRARLIDESSRSTRLSPEATQEAWVDFCARLELNPENPTPVPKEYSGLSEDGLRACASLEKRIQLWKESQFAPHVGDLFLKRRADLDSVLYRIIRVNSEPLIRELFFRLKNNEATFEELAAKFSTGREAQSGGQIGPVPFGSMNRELYEVLHSAQPGELLGPFKIAQVHLILKLERKFPAKLDAQLHARLVEDLCNTWIEERLIAMEQQREVLKTANL